MYCENCGKKVDADSNFCEHCGTKIKPEKMQKKMSKENKTIIGVLIIICFIFLFALELKYFNSPENAINNYLKNWENKNYDAILSRLNIENTEFTTSEVFQEVFKEKEEMKLTDFYVNGCDYQKKEKKAICKVSYQTEKNGITKEKSYILEQKEEKRVLLFSDWNIVADDYKMLEDWLLYIPTDATAKILEKDIKEYRFAEKDKNGFDCYKIPKILEGTYPVKVTMKDGIEIQKEVSIKSNEYTYHFNIKDIGEELKKELEDIGKNTVESFYQGIIQKKKLNDLEKKDNWKNLEETYNRLIEDLKNTELKDFSIDEAKITNLEMKDDGKIELTYQMKYTYEIGEEKKKNSNNDTFYITLKNINEKEIVSLDSLPTYFSKE